MAIRNRFNVSDEIKEMLERGGGARVYWTGDRWAPADGTISFEQYEDLRRLGSRDVGFLWTDDDGVICIEVRDSEHETTEADLPYPYSDTETDAHLARVRQRLEGNELEGELRETLNLIVREAIREFERHS